MAIPASGTAISVNTIVGEFGGTTPHSLSEYYRGGGLVPNTPGNANIPTSGAIPMAGFYGSANRTAIALSIASDTYNYDVYTNRSPAYVAGSSDITVTVNPGVTLGSTSTGTYALLVPSSFNPADTVTIVNNGVIQGMGGAGGNGASANLSTGLQGGGSPGSSGGHAIYVNRPTTIANNNVVASGGGGGGGGGSAISGPINKNNGAGAGGGGGGGAGFNGGTFGVGGTATAPVTRAPGAPGSAGTSPAGGAGGAGGVTPYARGGNAGAGGGRGASGAAGAGGFQPGGTGAGSSGGAAGNYIVGNPFVTWSATGTRQGGVA